MSSSQLPKIIDFSIGTTFARVLKGHLCTCKGYGVRAGEWVMWRYKRGRPASMKPIATARAHFKLDESDLGLLDSSWLGTIHKQCSTQRECAGHGRLVIVSGYRFAVLISLGLWLDMQSSNLGMGCCWCGRAAVGHVVMRRRRFMPLMRAVSVLSGLVCMLAGRHGCIGISTRAFDSSC